MNSTAKDSHSSSPANISVLIVEDEAPARDASERYLDYCGYQVTSAADAPQALQCAQESPPDVVICDWHLGDSLDGVDVARELQQRFGSRVVFITAYPLDRLRATTADIDVSRYLRKPLSLMALADTISAIVV